MSDNLLLNSSFELGWSDDGPRQVPNHWQFWYTPPDFPNWVDPSDAAQFSAPEMRHLTRSDIPPDEHSSFFFDDSDHTLKMFAPKWRTAYFSLTQPITVVEGHTYRLTTHLNPDVVDHYEGDVKVPAPDAASGQMRFIDGVPLDWFTMQPFLEKQTVTHIFTAPTTATFDIGAAWVFPHPLDGGSAVFTDAWELVVVGEPTDDCRGTPREQYRRVYHVIHPDASDERARSIFSTVVNAGRRHTVGWSYDDAGIGDLDKRAAVLWDTPRSERQGKRDWFTEHYSEVEVRFRGKGGSTPSPPPPPPPFMLPTYHMQRPFTGWIENVEQLAQAGKPLKWVFIVHEGMENVQVVRDVSPTTKGVYRHVISQGDQGALLANPDPKAAAYSFWKRFSDSALATGIDAVTSINETIGTGPGAAAERQATVAFDSAFAEVVAQESQGEIAPVTLLAPPGNPEHGAETEELVPAVIATAKAGGYLGPHTYFPCHPAPGISERWMANEGRHYHMRPMLSWYPTFKAAGVTDLPPLLLLETGAVGAYLRDDGRPGGFITAGMGWRDPGCLNNDVVRCLQLLIGYVGMIGEWNPKNDYLVECAAIFTQGYVGWEMFQFNREFGQLFDLLLG